MKVVIIGPVYPYRGGIAHFTAMLAQALKKRCDLLLVSFARLYPRGLYPGHTDKDPSRQPVSAEAVYWIDSINPLTWYRSAHRISATNPDGVVLEWWTTFLAPAYLALTWLLRRKRIPILFLIHNVLPHEVRWFDRWITRLLLKRGDSHLLLSEREKANLKALLPEVQRVGVCPHPVYDQFSKQRVPRDEAKRRLALSTNLPIILFFGFVRQYKGVNFLLESLGKLKEEGTEAFLLVAGEVWDEIYDYEKLAADFGIADRIRFDNRYIPNEEVGLYFSAADVYAAPYVGGTQSGSAKIAVSFGLPMVLTQQIADGLINVDPDQVVVVEPGDSSALAAALRKCISSSAGDHTRIEHTRFDEEWDALVQSIFQLIDGTKVAPL